MDYIQINREFLLIQGVSNRTSKNIQLAHDQIHRKTKDFSQYSYKQKSSTTNESLHQY
jgi:hypothetical protein